ncbi:hypothetical protein IVIADoCa4_16 [Xanthomonas phage vB_Xar_IVIA-DoCa4]|uniref:Uncharacterized protein n=1 Tax=Xanthomonas phage vB_Xar_IVIA-DoCa4 TaxID=2975531 RepID=A0A9X9JQE5_9CAUD|nr:hypothetical protein IVIADoCa4_16 [Xanthomonas phage vB_Xar_IVIA-DoCa4]
MSNDTNTAEQTQFSHAEVKLNELREDRAKALEKVAKIDEKIAAIEASIANEAAIEALKAGDAVAYVYGRALNKRVLSGTVSATKKNDKGIVQLKVEHGEGFDAEFHLIDATALLFTSEDIEKAQADIDAAKAAAEKGGEGGGE